MHQLANRFVRGSVRTAIAISVILLLSIHAEIARAQVPEPVDVEAQPLAANAERVIKALQAIGAPLAEATATSLANARAASDTAAIQKRLDNHVLLVVTINPEERVKVARGPAA